MEQNQILARLGALSTRWCDLDFVQGLLGLDLRADRQLLGAFKAWAERFRGKTEVLRQHKVDRYELETFLEQNGWISWKWAAIYLGLNEETLKSVVEKLRGKGVFPQLESGVSDQLVRQRGAATLFDQFPSIRLKVFSNHSSMCRHLHKAIYENLDIEVTPIFCVTSVALGEEGEERDFAAAFDAITLEPIGLRYQVWLDTKKPITLSPDTCSLKLYAQHEETLRKYIMRGGEPERIDPKLRMAV